MNNPTPAASGAAPADKIATVENVLRAMARNYSDRHAWDHLDVKACIQAADEIKQLRAALASQEAQQSPAPPTDEATAVQLWAEIWRLREAVKGPSGYDTWQDAATAERLRRVKAEAALASQEAQQSPAPPTDEQIDEMIMQAKSAWLNAGMDGPSTDQRLARLVEAALASPQVSPAQRNTMRAFEAWYCSDGNYEPEELDKLAGGACYANADTENMWQAWQGAFLHVAAPVQVAPHPDHSVKTAHELVMKWADIYAAQTGNLYAEAARHPSKTARMAPVRADLSRVLSEVLAAPVAPQDDARDAADPLQGAADWLKAALTPCTPYDIGGRLLIGYNRALRLFHATPAAKPKEEES